jgi:hypothetical protein
VVGAKGLIWGLGCKLRILEGTLGDIRGHWRTVLVPSLFLVFVGGLGRALLALQGTPGGFGCLGGEKFVCHRSVE